MSPIAAPVIIAEWPRNERECVRVMLDSFQGSATVSLRTWFLAPDGKMRPGTQGLTLGIRHVRSLADAFNACLAQAEAARLLPD